MKYSLLPERKVGIPLLMFSAGNYVLIICYHLSENPYKDVIEPLMLLPYIGGVLTIIYLLVCLPKLLNGSMSFFAIDEISKRK